MTTTFELGRYVASRADWNRSAWGRGVTEYALEILADMGNPDWDDAISDLYTRAELERLALNDAESWSQYSQGGCSLIYDCDIAERLCTPSELRKTRGGEREPNARESWLQVQARALRQAFGKIWIAYCNLGCSAA